MLNRSKLRRAGHGLLAGLVLAGSTVTFGQPGVVDAAVGPVSGKVFRDSNWNGTRDTAGSLAEGGIAGVTVRAFYDNNVPAGTTTTSATGDWTFNVTGPVRIEIDAATLPAGMYQSDRGRPFTFFGDGNQSNLDVPVVYPAEYINSADTGPFQALGSPISAPTATAPATPSSTTDSSFAITRQWAWNAPTTKGNLVGFPMTDTASDADTLPDIYGVSNRNGACNNTTTGALFGITMDPLTQNNYEGSIVKRHAPLGSTGSPGTIYQRCNPWQEVSGAAQANPHDTANMQLDATSVDDVGRRGVGGMDLSSDMTSLWAVDMTNERIVKIPFSTPTLTFTPVVGSNAFSIPNACGANTPQSMGLTVKDGYVYVGQTCEQVAASIRVLRFNEATNAWDAAPVLSGSVPVSRSQYIFPNRSAFFSTICNAGTPTLLNWAAWTDTATTFAVRENVVACGFAGAFNVWQPVITQAMVSDIDFDAAGNMIIGLRDRTADQMGQPGTLVVAGDTASVRQVYGRGDVVYATKSGSTFTLEAGPSTPTEYFDDSAHFAHTSTANDYDPYELHKETAMGTIAVSPASGRVAGTQFDPIDCQFGDDWSLTLGGVTTNNCTTSTTYNTAAIRNAQQYDSSGIESGLDEAGVRFWPTSGGVATHALAINLGGGDQSVAGDRGTNENEAAGANGGFGKGNGLGDMLVYTGIAPVGVGNRVFADRNNNGIQDPAADTPLPGVAVELVDVGTGTVVATTTTDLNGQYLFWVPGNVVSNYTVRIPSNQFTGAGPLVNYTLADTDTGSNDEADSDGIGTTNPAGLVTSNVDATVAVAGVGRSNRSVDFGFVPLIDLTLTKALTSANPTTVGATVTFTLTPRNEGPGTAVAGWSVTDILPSGLTLVSMSGTGYTCVANTCTSSTALPAATNGNVITVTATAMSTGVDLHNVAYVAPAAGDVPELNVLVVPNTSTDTAASATNNDAQAVVTVNTETAPAIEIVKFINGQDADTAPGVSVNAGDTMNITYEVTNIGAEDLENVVVTDDIIAAGDITCPATVLVVGATMTCTATYPAPAAGALHTNVGTVDADSVVDGAPVTDSNPANATSAAVLAGSPAIHVEKYINNDDADAIPGVMFAAGDLMNITFEVTNTGDVALGDVELHDSVLADADLTFVGGDTNGDGFLDVTETWLFEASMAAPLPGERHQNVATATGTYTPPTGPNVEVSDTDPANAWTPGNPAIEVVKTINGADANLAPGVVVADGSTMTVEFVVTNIGNVVLTNVILTDDVIADADITCPTDTLAVGGTMTCAATYPAPAVGVQHTNTAEVTGDYVQPNGQFIRVDDSDPANAHVPAPPAPLAPAIEIVKTINGADANDAPGVFVPAGSIMDIEFTVTNIGDADLTDVIVTDDMIADADITCPADVLAAGESMVCTATLAAPAAGTVHTNTGTAVGTYTPPTGAPVDVTDEDPANAWTPGDPQIRIVKSINGDDANVAPGVAVVAGAPMAVTFDVTNIGDVPLSNVRVTDSVLADTDITCPATVLAVGATMECTATLPALAAEGATHTNTAQATGDFVWPTGELIRVTDTDPANAHVPAPGTEPGPAVKIVKFINDQDANLAPGVKVPAGSSMTIKFVVTNEGNVPLADVTITDNVIPAAGIAYVEGDTNGNGLLDLTETWGFEGSFPAPAAGAVHSNIGTVDANYIDPVDGSVLPVTDTDPANAWVEGNPELELVKYINGADANVAPGVLVAADSTMTVTFEVTNTGDVTVDEIVVTDNVIPAGDIVCPQTSLAAGASMTCTADLTAPSFGGTHSNIATVDGVYVQPDGTREDLTDEDPANAHADALPGIEIVKFINGDDANALPGVNVAPGSTMSITFEVTNTSDVQVDNIVVTDDMIDAGDIVCPETSLAAGESMTCTATLAAPAAGTVHTNVATVNGDFTDVAGTVFPVTDSDPASAWTVGVPAIQVIKSINGDDANAAPGVAVAAGSTMNITFVVTNIGEVPLSNVRVTDSVLADADIVCPADVLAVGASFTCTATLIAPAEGVQHTNTAVATGDFIEPNGVLVTVTDNDPANAFVPGAPGLQIEKLVNGDDADFAPGIAVAAGSTLTFDMIVTNIGQVPVSNVVVADDTLASVTYVSGDLNGDDMLDVGEVWMYTATQAAPAAGGVHTNIATVTGDWTNPVDGTVVDLTDNDPANAHVPGRPRLEIVKFINGADANTAPGVLVAAGSTMNITFEVTNTGDVEVANIAVTDNVIPAGDIVCPQTSLAAGATMTCTATLVAPAAGGTHTNTGFVTGDYTQPDGTVVELTDNDPANAHADAEPGIQIVKFINGADANAIPGVYVAPGSTMNITFEVTNIRPVALANVTVTDNVFGAIVCPRDTLAAAGSIGDTMTCSTTAPAPAAGTVHSNVATVVGDFTDVAGTVTTVTDNDPANAWTVGQPLIEVVKYIDGDDANLAPGVRTVAGATMNVTFEVRNVGLVPLSNVYVFDNVIDQADITCPAVTLAVGASMTCTATYPAPAINGTHTNMATAHGEFVQPNGVITPVEDTDPANAYTPGDPAITIVKTINGEDANTQPEYVRTVAGSTMAIEYLVTNTGTVQLQQVLVTDPVVGNSNVFCPADILEAGESMVCTATFPAAEPGEYHTNTGFVRGNYVPANGPIRQVRDNDPAWAYTPVIDLELVKDVTTGGVGATNNPAFIPANTKTGTVGTIRLDRPFQYQITVTNKPVPGAVADDATGVTISDLIDESSAIVITGFTPSQGTCDLAAGTCDLGTIANGASVTIVVDAVLPRANVDLIPADGLLVNNAEVADAVEVDVDSIPGNGFAPTEDDDNPAWVKVNLADLELVKQINTVDNGVDSNGVPDRDTPQDEQTAQLPVAIGAEAVWTIKVVNQGPDAATGVTVNDVLPAEFTFVSAASANGTYDPATNTWTVGGIAVGQTVTLNITAILAPVWAGDQAAIPARVVNVAEVITADQDDPDSLPGDGVTDADDIDDAFADPTVGTLGDFVWLDTNGNGIQDGGELGIEGVTVTLTMDSDVTDSLGNVIVPAGSTLTTMTDASGHYLFTNLYGGDYTITFSVPAGMQVTGVNAGGDDTKDSDADAAGVVAAVLENGATDLTYDMGVFVPASIGDIVWEDLNGNGIQDGGEPGVAGVTVTLTDAFGHTATTTTDADGMYLFDGLTPGEYHVEVSAPAGYVLTVADAGTDDAADSDANTDGVMPATVLVSGENDMTWDAGLVRPVSIGNFVWLDADRDGIQDADEVGVADVTVTLTGVDGAGNAVSLTEVTDADGMYLFDNLMPGTYTVTFAVPASYELTGVDLGDDAVDSDAGEAGVAPAVTLVSGAEDLTIDAGLVQMIDLQVVKTGVITGVDTNTAASNAVVTWTFTVTNNGPAAAAVGATVHDELPAGLLFASVNVPQGWSCAAGTPAVGTDGGSLHCVSTAVMPVGGTATFSVIQKVSPSYNAALKVAKPGVQVGEWLNVVTVATAASQSDSNSSNNVSSAPVKLIKPPAPTGSDAAPILLAGFGAAVAGIGLLLIGRRRRKAATV